MKKHFLFLLSVMFITLLVHNVSFAQQQSDPAKAADSKSTDTQSSVFTDNGLIHTPWAIDKKDAITARNPSVVIKRSFFRETKEIIESLSTLQYKYAMLLNVNMESLKNTALLGFMDDWFGTKYRYGGNSKKGIDCSALTERLLFAVYGLSSPRTAREQYAASEHIDKDDLKEGDLVFFKTKSYVSHVGLYLKNGYFLHASSSHGVTISNLDEPYFTKRFVGAGRMSE